jgi:molybdate transport system regulatory protein
MSYRHAWMLVDDMNKCFRNPVIEARPGAPQGGHATLTPLGKKLIEQYRAIEAAAWLATSKHVHEIEAFLNTSTVSRPTTSIKRSLRTAAA